MWILVSARRRTADAFPCLHFRSGLMTWVFIRDEVPSAAYLVNHW
jgi:hypothetical protein